MRKSFNNDYRKLNNESFLLELYQIFTKENPEHVAHHWHNEPEIIFCNEGAIDIICNGKTYQMSRNDILFINSSQIHSVHVYPFSHNTTFVFDLNSCISQRIDSCDKEFLLPLKNLESVICSEAVFHGDDKKTKARMVEVFNNIVSLELNRPYGYQLQLKGYLFLLLYLFVSAAPIVQYQNEQHKNLVKNYESLRKVLNYYDSNYNEKISIEELAKLAHMSPSYFCKYFKNFTGSTPVEYLNMIRIENASKLLITTDQKIIDIAFEVGFQNFSYFSKVFKELKKASPSEYRVLLTQDAELDD